VPSSDKLYKIETLNACLSTIRKFFDAFLAQYTTSMPSIPYFYWMRLIHGLSILTKLSFLHCDGWDLEYVRNKLNFGDVVDRLNHKLWMVQEAEAGDDSAGLSKRFRAYRAKMEKTKHWFNEMVAQEQRAANAAAGGSDAAGTENFDDPMFYDMFENLDEYLNFAAWETSGQT
jgi:hypothetical protein